jgi:hypothetical protein
MPEVTFAPGTVNFEGGSVGISMSLPLDWMARGFIAAVERSERAAKAPGKKIARDLAIALFEAGNWIDSMASRCSDLAGDVRAQGFRFVRNQTHHQYAAAVEFDESRDEWVWRDPAYFPEAPEGFRDERKERCYRQALQGRAVTETLRHIAKLVQPHVVVDRRFSG